MADSPIRSQAEQELRKWVDSVLDNFLFEHGLDFKSRQQRRSMVEQLAQIFEAHVDALAARDPQHASAPTGYKCSDCTIDGEPCPRCYEASWQQRHPNVEQLPQKGDPRLAPQVTACVEDAGEIGIDFDGGRAAVVSFSLSATQLGFATVLGERKAYGRKTFDSPLPQHIIDHLKVLLANPPARLPEADQANYPCDDCGRPRSAEQGGKVFTVCDDCWDRHYAKLKAARLHEGQEKR